MSRRYVKHKIKTIHEQELKSFGRVVSFVHFGFKKDMFRFYKKRFNSNKKAVSYDWFMQARDYRKKFC